MAQYFTTELKIMLMVVFNAKLHQTLDKSFSSLPFNNTLTKITNFALEFVSSRTLAFAILRKDTENCYLILAIILLSYLSRIGNYSK